MVLTMDIKQLMQWVVTTPPLFQGSEPIVSKVPFIQPSYQQWPTYQGNQRLGFIYQFLCQQLFTATPRYNAVSEEIQLNQQGTTLGSIDFIAKNRKTEQYEHWEVAVKFYLLHQGNWYGPNAEDRLDLKLNHMLNHQLPLSSNEAFCKHYPLWANAKPHLLMQGRLYTNPFQPEPVPNECLGHPLNPSQIQGHWCYQHQQSLIDEPLYRLEKPQWLTGRDKQSPRYQGEDLGFVHCQSQSGLFWFIMPNDWPATT
ncbi:type II citrate synthase [Vibrio metschnikovii]|nr:type II citrate synthase [Vibrio metschnikovii]SUP50666.1 type II citrate synthase [Vibrio metschnikovii]